MEIKPYDLSDQLILPLALYESMPIADVVANDGDHFVVVVGLDRHMAGQVKHYSLSEDDLELQENTSDRKRFGEGSYEEWYAKGRVPFALMHEKSDTLTAICWFGPKPIGQKSMKYLSDEELKDVFGIGITIVTTCKDKNSAKAFLEYLGFPFKKVEEAKIRKARKKKGK